MARYYDSRVPGAPHLAFEMWGQIRAQREPFSPSLTNQSKAKLAENYPTKAHNKLERFSQLADTA
jgi:hypothetical protein